MRFLVDENLSRHLPDLLRSHGHDAEHVQRLGLKSAPDSEILATARLQDRILISADTDFGTLLAASGAERPSVILIRRTSGRRAFHLATMIEANLPDLGPDLEAGCVVVFDAQRVRVRSPPVDLTLRRSRAQIERLREPLDGSLRQDRYERESLVHDRFGQ